MKKTIISMGLLCVALGSVFVYAESVPRRVAADTRVRVVMYDANNVVILKGKYGYQTQVSFATGETVQSVSVGDSLAWQAVPVGNNLFIKPIATSKTNMTVLTNLNSYNFQLDSLDPKVIPTYKLRFTYPESGYSQSTIQTSTESFDPEKLNWKYSFTGDRSLAPIEAFDNNQFTYLKFKNDGGSRLPSVFIVDKDKNESLINYHMQGDYMVVNSIAKQFTLRDGSYVTSIYNDNAIGDWKSVRG